MGLFYDFNTETIQGVLSILYLITILFVSLMIIFENRSPVKTLSWVMVVLLIPFAGILIYIFFGQEYRKRKIFSRKGLKDIERFAENASIQIRSIGDFLSGESNAVREKEHLMKLMLNNNKAILTKLNQIEVLIDGDQTFPAMIDSIRNAAKYIHMQFYRLDFDDLGREFISVLMEKAEAGVEVRIIFDDVGSWNFPNSTLKKMKSAGVEIFPFMPVRFPLFTNKINFRNHRKIMVIDGTHGYIGGLNIARKYLFGLKELGKWRDTHLRIEGESVAALNSIFLIDWFFVSGVALTHLPEYSTVAGRARNCLVQVASSGPDSDWASIMQAYFSAIATARHSIFISTPYFSPDESILNALKTASLSGVEVRLLIPVRADSAIAHWNSLSYVAELLDAGIRVFLYQTGFNHSKYMIVDGVFSIVGSANLDMRSFELNFEVTALIYNEEFANKMLVVFGNDIKNSEQIVPEEWDNRKRSWRYKESLSRILGPLY
jgi:cardiolipin synthase A/B